MLSISSFSPPLLSTNIGALPLPVLRSRDVPQHPQHPQPPAPAACSLERGCGQLLEQTQPCSPGQGKGNSCKNCRSAAHKTNSARRVGPAHSTALGRGEGLSSLPSLMAYRQPTGLDPPGRGLWALAHVGTGPGWEEPCWAAIHPPACTAFRVSQRALDPQVTKCCHPMQSPWCSH